MSKLLNWYLSLLPPSKKRMQGKGMVLLASQTKKYTSKRTKKGKCVKKITKHHQQSPSGTKIARAISNRSFTKCHP